MPLPASRAPRAGQYYSQSWAQDVVGRISDILRFLSGQVELDIPLLGLSSRAYFVTDVTAATYIAAKADHFISVNRAGVVAITLTDNPYRGQVQIVQDASGLASSNIITVSPASGAINGQSFAQIQTDFGRVSFLYNGTTWLADAVLGIVPSPAAADLILSTTAPTRVEA